VSDPRFARIERLIGAAGLRRLAGCRVAVVGLGAVGSYAVEGLARAGVGALRLVDHDEVRPTNLNRQLLALESTLGQPKVEAGRRRVLEINPACRVEALRTFVHVETLDAVLAGPPDLVVDAIDSMTPKVALLAAAVERRIPVISAMGAALRTDPTCVRVGPLSKCERCPLAATVRKQLRRRGVPVDFPCVYSVEPVAGAIAGAIDRDGAEGEEILERGRPRRALGSLPTLTGIFGLVAANEGLRILLGELFPAKK
jgi:tRNA threonylcarbamoyladenosine dehydratase